MSIPSVTCGADVIVAQSSSPQTISLTASASGSPTSWRWDILSVAPGSMANVGVKGDFTDGVSFIQNPTLEIDAYIDGGYCIQCRATNSDGQSDPAVDKGNGQQLIIVQVGTTTPILELAPDYAYDWGETYNNPNLRALRNAIIASTDDKKVKVSADDSTPNFLESKIAAGSNVTLTVLNPGAAEQISFSATDTKTKAVTGDTTPGFLGDKLVAGTNISLTTLNPSGNAQIQINASGGGSDIHDVKAASGDTTPGFLESKLVAGSNITLTTLNPSGNAQIRIASSGGSGGLTPVFQWNGIDTSEFLWEFGDSVSEINSSVEINNISSINTLYVNVRFRGNSGLVSSIVANGDGTATIYSPLAEFRNCDVGKSISISGATDPNNDGSFYIISSSYEYITYDNALASSEDPTSASWSLYISSSFLDSSIILIPDSLSAGTNYMIVSDVYYFNTPTGNIILGSRLNYSWVSGTFDVKGFGLQVDVGDTVGSVELNNLVGGVTQLNTPLEVSWTDSAQGSRLMHGSYGADDDSMIYEEAQDFRFVHSYTEFVDGFPGIIVNNEDSAVGLFNIRVFEITNPATVSTGRWY